MNLSASENGNFNTTQACKKNPPCGTMLCQFHSQILSPCISKIHHNVILPPLGLENDNFPNFSHKNVERISCLARHICTVTLIGVPHNLRVLILN
jgi:hypothetical protein